jgi:uncharacterized surface protein with fasciclin (FAS1) repeats
VDAVQCGIIDGGVFGRGGSNANNPTPPPNGNAQLQPGTKSTMGDVTMQIYASTQSVAHTGKLISLAVCLSAIILGGTGTQAKSANLFEEVTADERLTLFANAVNQAGLSDMLKQEGPFILFVPSDQAMTDEGSAFLLDSVLLTKSNAERLKDLVSYHIVPSTESTGTAASDGNLPTMTNSPLHMTRLGTARIINGWAVVTDRKETDNGVLYVVDRLLSPGNQSIN